MRHSCNRGYAGRLDIRRPTRSIGFKETRLASLVLNFADDTPLDWYPVSREVNNVRNEHPDLIRPAPVEREFF